MKTRAEIIEALECIISSGNAGMRDNCANCIYPGGGDCLAPALKDALALLKEPDKFQIKTTISNVDIPTGIDEEQFFAVLSQQYAALARLYGDDVVYYSPSGVRKNTKAKRDQVLEGLRLCRYDPDPGQECKQLVSCDICPYWSDEVGCRMLDMFNDAIDVIEGKA